jgi:hypothetical protein
VYSTGTTPVVLGDPGFLLSDLALNTNPLASPPLLPLASSLTTYTALGIVGLTGTLYLDASALAADSEWTFTFTAAFTTAAESKIVFVKDSTTEYSADDLNTDNYKAYAARVKWFVNGPIILGASSKMPGAMKSGETITLGASSRAGDLCADAAILVGASANSRSLSSNAAVTVGASGFVGAIRSGAAITIGAGSTIRSLTAAAATSVGAAVTCAHGDPWSTGCAGRGALDNVFDCSTLDPGSANPERADY